MPEANLLPIVIPQVFYLAESKADLQQVKRFINAVEQNFFRIRRPNGGSDEYWEAYITLGNQTFGLRYISPREGFAGLDGFMVTAIVGESHVYHKRVNLEFNPGETKHDATRRWICAAQEALDAAALRAQIPYQSMVVD